MKQNLKFLRIALISSITFAGACQQTQKDPEFIEAVVDNSKAVYQNSKFHEVNAPPVSWSEEGEVKNVILMIGDGMGIAQVFAGIAANKGKLNIINFPHSGFVLPMPGIVTLPILQQEQQLWRPESKPITGLSGLTQMGLM
jgi:alkaline phosphatase